MTGICAIYSSFAQTRQPILSLTSTAIRASSQPHVRRNSVLTCAYNTSIGKPVFNSVRKVQALSQIHSEIKFGGSLFTVSFIFFNDFYMMGAVGWCKKNHRKIQSEFKFQSIQWCYDDIS